MKFLDGLKQLESCHRPCVATIGNFDGVHLGHQRVVETLLKAGRERQLPSTVISFEPLAREYFSPNSVLRLSSIEQRCQDLEQLGVDQVLCLEFNSSLIEMSPLEFVSKVLIDGLGVKYLSVGDDFRFGKNRAGDFEYLKSISEEYGFEVENHQSYCIDDVRVSSGQVREAVATGDFEQAERYLGRPYSLSGVVRLGQQLGRTIGFPTANIVLNRENYAVKGVYAVTTHVPDVGRVRGVANIGTRPTVDGKENRLEVHLFDFDGDIYDQPISVEFHTKIRDEQKFDSFDLLKKQIEEDALMARQFFDQGASK